MKSEEKLKLTYNLQEVEFKRRKDLKLQNLQKQEQNIAEKIKKLQSQLDTVRNQRTKLEKETFPSFSSFRFKIEEQSKKDKAETKS